LCVSIECLVGLEEALEFAAELLAVLFYETNASTSCIQDQNEENERNEDAEAHPDSDED
jgi:hypothetical protein